MSVPVKDQPSGVAELRAELAALLPLGPLVSILITLDWLLPALATRAKSP
jgi:hypothetical protein